MTAAARLTLAQWLSPAFPVGGFAYSQGLEWAIARLEETEAQGAAFAAAARALGLSVAPAPYPLAVGRAARALDLPATEIAGLWLQAQATNLTQIAVRLVPLGQGDAQRVLAALQPLILRLAEDAATADPDALGSASLRADLAAMQHETMEVRLCRT